MTLIAPTDLALQVEVPPAAPYLANMLQNPDGRFGGWFWVTDYAGMVSSPSPGVLRLSTGPAVSGAGGMMSHAMPLKAGQNVRAAWSATLTPGTLLTDGYQAAFYYYDAAGALIITSPTKLVKANGAQVMDHVAPAGTVAVRLNFQTVRVDINGTLDFTGLKMARDDTLAALDYIDPEPVTWATITSSAGNTIDIARAALNTGTLTAVLRDATLDPTVTGGLRPGRKVRVTGGGAVVFTGEVLDVHVDYTKPKTATSDPVGTITVAAVDATALLAAAAAPNGVGVLSELPHVLEGGKVPWNVAGNTGHVPTPSKFYITDNATALDQVSVTCMTYHAHAYVNPAGVLTINTAPPTSGVVLSDVAEPSYVAIDVGFSTDECVNSVTVDKITQDAGGATVTVKGGPYEDFDSIEEWNRHAATYTIQCVTGAGGKSNAGFGAEVLAANKTPGVKVRGFTFLVEDTADIATALAMDLTHLVDVVWQGTTYTVRVAAVRHTITARPDAARPVAWHTTVEAVLPGTTNLPVVVPTP